MTQAIPASNPQQQASHHIARPGRAAQRFSTNNANNVWTVSEPVMDQVPKCCLTQTEPKTVTSLKRRETSNNTSFTETEIFIYTQHFLQMCLNHPPESVRHWFRAYDEIMLGC